VKRPVAGSLESLLHNCGKSGALSTLQISEGHRLTEAPTTGCRTPAAARKARVENRSARKEHGRRKVAGEPEERSQRGRAAA